MEKGLSQSPAIVPEPLNDLNYVDWSDLVQTYLLAHDLWDVVVKVNAAAADDDDQGPELRAQNRVNAAALHAIKISCGPKARSMIRGVWSAREAWLKLAQLKPDPNPELEPEPATASASGTSPNDDNDYEHFFHALRNGNWKAAKKVYDQDGDVLEKRVPNSGNLTALHLAVTSKNVRVVEDMVKSMRKEALELKDYNGSTPLAVATVTGITRIAKCIVEKNIKTVSIPNERGSIPVVMALSYGCLGMARYLYSVTPLNVLLLADGSHGSTIITKSIEMKVLDIALHLLRRCPDLAFAKDRDGKTPIYVLSCVVSLFSCGCNLIFWKRWIYNSIHAEPNRDTYNIFIRGQGQGVILSTKSIVIHSVLGVLQRLPSYLLKFSGIRDVYEMKSTDIRCTELLHIMGEKTKTLQETEMKDGLVYDAMFSAVDRGNVKFIVELTKSKPELWRSTDANSRDIFMRAVQCRQEEIFSLIHITGEETKALAGVKVDKYKNNMLHIAALLAPFSQLNRVSGAALQMQEELQWFEEVEKVVPQAASASENINSLTPRDLFSQNHKDLIIEGEKWMKTTSSSCTVVGALIITMTFTAIFTVPGGNDQNTGIPIFLHKPLFRVFMIANAMSLFSSATSVLMFLAILTSRYAVEDFRVSLPRKLMFGLLTLFVSIVSMLVAFCSTLVIILGHKTGVLIPVILTASIPVICFGLMQFSLLLEIIKSTYRPSILSKKVTSKYLFY